MREEQKREIMHQSSIELSYLISKLKYQVSNLPNLHSVGKLMVGSYQSQIGNALKRYIIINEPTARYLPTSLSTPIGLHLLPRYFKYPEGTRAAHLTRYRQIRIKPRIMAWISKSTTAFGFILLAHALVARVPCPRLDLPLRVYDPEFC